MYNLNYYDYDLPENLIAQTPLKVRSESKLLILNKKTGAVKDEIFKSRYFCLFLMTFFQSLFERDFFSHTFVKHQGTFVEVDMYASSLTFKWLQGSA